jgi:hypothetical protein
VTTGPARDGVLADQRSDAQANLRHRPADDPVEHPLERLELLSGDDDAIAAFLDELDVRGTREREMLTELARTTTVADADQFVAAHTRAVSALETLARNGYVGSGVGARLGRLGFLLRTPVELVARYIVVSYLRSAASAMRNLYWLREIESPSNSRELKLFRPARFDAQALDIIFKRREIGLPAFVIGGILLPLTLSIVNVSSGLANRSWWVAVIIGLVGAVLVVAISWVILRGAAMANRRIHLTAEQPLETLWTVVGSCGQPPKGQSRRFAIVAIVLSVAAWILVPLAVALALAS